MANRVPDVVVIGHLTLDRTPEGDVLGGSVLYSALTAARYGARTAILTRANLDILPPDQKQVLTDISSEIEIIVQSSKSTTTFTNVDVGGRRQQSLHAWAEEIDLNGLPPLWRSAGVIHLAPVAQEIDPRQVSRLAPRVLGTTPQGWMRLWNRTSFGRIRLDQLRLPAELVARIDVLVVSHEESVAARDTVEAVGQRGLAVITRGDQGARAIDRGQRRDVPFYPARPVNTVGAGDVFAGGLLAARGGGESVAASLRYAAAAAALKVGGEGVTSAPYHADVLARIERDRD
ncbi:MAG: PfkB family carbohydrate kinase [Thermomicrobiales bacterium]|nr:PfkB family carbohydrate kinase [Thermomicrobiales bacterium]